MVAVVIFATQEHQGLQIDKGIPIPSPEGETRWHFLTEMEVGDSFFLDRLGDRSEGTTRNILVNFTNRTGWRFMSRGVVGGIRFWRIE